MTRIRPKNWASYQHYKDRDPTWIKLHKRLLDDYEFQCLPLASRALAPMLWLIASEDKEGWIDADPRKLAFRLRCSNDELSGALNALIDGKFFESENGASDPLAEPESIAIPEKENKGQVTNSEEDQLSADADQTLPPKPKAVKQPQAPKGEKRNAYPADFEEFWAGYPTDKNMGKAETLAPWLKLDADERRQAIAALPGFREYCRQNQNWYRPSHAVKFLKARRFEQYAAAGAEKDASAEQHDASLQATFTAWNGSAEKLCGRIGDKAFSQWFVGSTIHAGPPARILVAKQFMRDQILSKYGPMLVETFGNDVRVEVSP